MRDAGNRRRRNCTLPDRRGRPLLAEPLEERRLLAVAWQPLGPAPILDGLTPAHEHTSGRVVAIAPHPTQLDVIYAAGADGGVWKTIDSGKHWTPLTDDQPTLAMGALALAPSNPDIIYAGTGEAHFSFDSVYGLGLLKSIDGGASWTLTGGDVFRREAISRIVVHPTDPNVVYAATARAINSQPGNKGVWKSVDGGATWTNTTAGISSSISVTDLVMDPTNPNVLVAGYGELFGNAVNGLYRTADGGASWSPLGVGVLPSGEGVGRVNLAISSDGRTLYAAWSNPGEPFGSLLGFFQSTDGGQTWIDRTASTPNYMDSQGWYDNVLAVHPRQPQTVFAGGAGDADSVIRSTDGGQTWTDVSISLDGGGPHPDHHALVFDAIGRLLDGTDGGIWRGNSLGATWTNLNGNLDITQFYDVAQHPTNPQVILGGTQDNGTIRYAGNQSWTTLAGGDGGIVQIDPINPSIIYQSFNYNREFFLRRSDDGGQTFNVKVTGIDVNDPGRTIIPYELDPSNPARLVLGTNRVYQSTNRGDMWFPISPVLSGSLVAAVEIAEGNPATIYVSYTDGSVWVTFNGGQQWQSRSGGLPILGGGLIPAAAEGLPRRRGPQPIPSAVPGTSGVGDITIDPSDHLTAYLVRDVFGQGKAWRTSDGGQNWIDISGDLPDVPAQDIVIDPRATPDVLYVGTDLGVFRSSDLGGHWQRWGTGLPNAIANDLEINLSYDRLIAGTHGRGAWVLPIGPRADDDDDGPFPEPLVPQQPLGSLIYNAQASGTLDFAGDEDRFTLGLDAGQTVAIVVRPSGAIAPRIELRDPSGNVLSSSAAAAGENGSLPPTLAAFSGSYTIAIRDAAGATGDYAVEVILGAAAEAESLGGGSNDAVASAQPIDGSSLPLNSAARRLAVLGTADGTTQGDLFSFVLTAGQRATVAVATESAAALGVELLGPNGQSLESGAAAANLAAVVERREAIGAGLYYARVTGDPATPYSLLVTIDAAFDIEPNDEAGAAQSLAGLAGALGGLTTADEDWYAVELSAGTPFRAAIAAPGAGSLDPVNGLWPHVELIDSLGQTVAIGTGDSRETLSYAPHPPGTYRLRVRADNQAAGAYMLSLLPDTDAPRVQVVQVAPDPRDMAVGVLLVAFDEPVVGFELSDLVLSRGGGANLLTTAQTLSSADGVLWTVGNLAGLTLGAGTYELTLIAAESGIADLDGNSLVQSATETWTVNPAAVIGRHVFYNRSWFDGNNPAAGAPDDEAVATDKQQLLPGGTATFANYTSYSRGINGVMVDVARLPGPLTAADFTFRVGNDDNSALWTNAAPPSEIAVRHGEGKNGSSRVSLIWPDGAIAKQWLQVTVQATQRTGLDTPDVFYFGNAIGETGDLPANAIVSPIDEQLVRISPRNLLVPAAVSLPFDMNRDTFVNAADQLIARANKTSAATALKLIHPPVAPAPAPQAGVLAMLVALDAAEADAPARPRRVRAARLGA